MQFADFISCAFDQIVNMAATLRYRHGGSVSCPIVIRAPSGANIHGGIFHSQNPEGWFFHQPGLKIVAPATAYDAKGLLKAAIRDNDPVLYFENKYLYRRAKSEVPAEDYIVPLGKAEVRREGSDITVVAYGVTVHQSLAAAEQLAAEGVSVEVIDLRSLVPMDKEAILNSVRKTSKVLITHEAARRGGVGAEIAAMIAEELFDYLDGPIMRVAAENIPVPFSPPMEEFCLPSADKIAAALRKLALY
jgi:2-oxoisovalerate dehydrogenase E1 component beta subunit